MRFRPPRITGFISVYFWTTIWFPKCPDFPNLHHFTTVWDNFSKFFFLTTNISLKKVPSSCEFSSVKRNKVQIKVFLVGLKTFLKEILFRIRFGGKRAAWNKDAVCSQSCWQHLKRDWKYHKITGTVVAQTTIKTHLPFPHQWIRFYFFQKCHELFQNRVYF